MANKSLGVVFLCGLVGMVSVGSLSCTKDTAAAEKAEREGDYRNALDSYLSILVDRAQKVALPEVGDALAASPEQWQKEVGEVIGTIVRSSRVVDSGFNIALQGIGRCTTFVQRQNMFRRVEREKFALGEYTARWERAFFPQSVPMHAKQRPLVEEAMKKDVSLVRFAPRRKGFSYEGHIVHLKAGYAIPFTLYEESSFSVPLIPGPHAMITLAKASFPTGQVWESSESFIPFEVPATASLVSAIVETRVERK